MDEGMKDTGLQCWKKSILDEYFTSMVSIATLMLLLIVAKDIANGSMLSHNIIPFPKNTG